MRKYQIKRKTDFQYKQWFNIVAVIFDSSREAEKVNDLNTINCAAKVNEKMAMWTFSFCVLFEEIKNK